MMTWPRLSRLGLPAILVAAALTACTVAPNTSLQAPQGQVEIPAPIGGEAANTLEAGIGLPPGADLRSLSDERHHVYASWYALAGEPGFGQGQEQAVRQEVDAYTAGLPRSGSGGGGSATAGELNIAPTLTGLSARMLGVRLGSYVGGETPGGTSYRTLWYDREDRTTLSTRDLFASDAAWSTFRTLVADGLQADPDVLPDQARESSPELLDSLNFDTAGNALVEFDDGALAPASESPVLSRVGSADLLPLLNDRGLAVRSAGMDPGIAAEPAARTGDSAADMKAPARKAPDCAQVRCIALTFEDGPGPSTARLLSVLDEHDAPATFFVLGSQAGRHAPQLRQALAAGHEIGNHGWSHRDLSSMPAEQARLELGRTDDAVAAATGAAPTLTRPPYGAATPALNRLAHTPVVLWDLDPLDWAHDDPRMITDAVLEQAHPGAIVQLHGLPATAEALPRILSGLEARGYHLATVSELLSPESPQAQVAYKHGPAGK